MMFFFFFKKKELLCLKIVYLFRNGFLIAPGHVLVREAAEDTVLEIPKPHGQMGTTTIPVPKGLQVS